MLIFVVKLRKKYHFNRIMKKILYWIPTAIFLLGFGILIFVYHIFQVLAYKLFGYQAHKKVVDSLLWWLNHIIIICGYTYKVENLAGDLPIDKPMIIVSNHQGMFDISMIGYTLRKHHPKYVSKIELATGIPSISYNLRHGGSVLIDRKNGKDAIVKIKDFAKYLNENNRAGVIFPEGTRTRDGKMRVFKPIGLKVMLKEMPDATVVPVALEDFWHIEKYGLRPVPFGRKIKCTILPPIDRSKYNNNEVIALLEEQIKAIAERNVR